jgi:hypothetical protein
LRLIADVSVTVDSSNERPAAAISTGRLREQLNPGVGSHAHHRGVKRTITSHSMVAKVTRAAGYSVTVVMTRQLKSPDVGYWQAEGDSKWQAQKKSRAVYTGDCGFFARTGNKTCFAHFAVVNIFTTTTQYLRRGSKCTRSTSHATL